MPVVVGWVHLAEGDYQGRRCDRIARLGTPGPLVFPVPGSVVFWR